VHSWSATQKRNSTELVEAFHSQHIATHEENRVSGFVVVGRQDQFVLTEDLAGEDPHQCPHFSAHQTGSKALAESTLAGGEAVLSRGQHLRKRAEIGVGPLDT